MSIDKARQHNNDGYTTYLEVHVAIRADEETLVLQTPLEADVYRLAGELLHERLRVDGVDLERARTDRVRNNGP